ncbi:thiamine pyrophosphate-dependent dehydrogenase E1 component subunit alpha [Kribbella sp. NPDC050124]|uniref:thiamine pyrophosphate-dependent dehydrogenase E1 component subunit alpha n=1 Tax=Kribbella sp. NPDC050124 TaxID=3364114 RepID=UPI0037A796EF
MSQGTALQRRAALADPVRRYERMMEIRTVEDTINELFASGAIHGTTHLCQGQEAVAVGLASVTRPDDVVTATYRGHGVALALGMTPLALLAEIMGKMEGCAGGVGGSMHMSDPEIGLLPTFAIVGAGLPVAAGAALAFQTRGEQRAAIAVFGDGATNIGAFHESLNLAAIWKLPVVFVIDNNVYGEYCRWNLTTPLENLHQRAASYAMPASVVDGMDLDAVRGTVGAAVERAREGGGPTLVEAKTYRFAGHSRSDPAPYRPEGEFESWRSRDPVALAARELVRAGHADESGVQSIDEAVRARIAAAVVRAVALPATGVEAMFRNVWTEPLRAVGTVR